jgi:hypothetical protein
MAMNQQYVVCREFRRRHGTKYFRHAHRVRCFQSHPQNADVQKIVHYLGSVSF